MKNVLVLDDEIDLAEVVANSLKENGYLTNYCNSVDDALGFLKTNQCDLIISDIRMPEKDGLEFFNTIKADLKSKNIAFVFMTGHSDRISIQSAYDMGVDEFVSKPFDLEDLNLVVNLILKNNLKSNADDEKFYKINMSEFLLASVNEYDVYLKVNESFLCLAKKGQELLPERLMNYNKKGMKYIYLSSVDFARYVGMQVNLSEVVKTKPIEKVKKIKLFNHFCKSINESALSEHMNEEMYTKVFSSFENYSQIAIENNEVFRLMNSLNQFDHDRSSKSVIVSFLALAVFQAWKWTHPKHLSKVALGALLCDIGLEEVCGGFGNKPYDEMTAEEIKLYEKHPLQSYMQLSKIKNIPEEVLYIVLQHHENDSGLGFPQKTPKVKLHPYSRVVHALYEFIDQVDKINCKQSIKECLDVMLSFQKKLVSQQVIKTLYNLFDLPVPAELANVLLPTDTTRLT